MNIDSQPAIENLPGTPDVNPTPSESHDDAEESSISPLALDNVDKFVFQGHEYTPEELSRAMLRHADYTRKTQEIAKQRKWESQWQEHLSYDLEKVRDNPQLAQEFRKHYPEKFHRYLDVVLRKTERVQNRDEGDGQEAEQKMPSHVVEKLKKLEAMEAKLEKLDRASRERDEQFAIKHLDTIFSKMSEKYPYAFEDAVLNKAQVLMDENQGNDRFQMTDAVWERVFKSVNDTYAKRVEKTYRSRMESQLKKSEKASDSGPGGAAPGRGPSGPRTFAEATQMAIEDIRARGHK
jgi:hypothetical protein